MVFEKAKIKKDESSLMNARIKIDYSKNKPDIKFSYPSKKTQVRGSMLLFVQSFWCLILVFLYIILSVCSISNLGSEAPGEIRKFAECTAMNSYQTLTNYSNVRDNLCKKQVKNIFHQRFYFLLYIFVLVFLPPFLIYYPFRKKWDKLYPKMNGIFSIKKLRIFNKKDIKKSKGRYPYFVELPVFNNIICNFDASKDFSKYMKEFEIREHKFYHLRKKTIKVKGKKKKFRKVNEFIWYARWYFNEKPLKGALKVIYK